MALKHNPFLFCHFHFSAHIKLQPKCNLSCSFFLPLAHAEYVFLLYCNMRHSICYISRVFCIYCFFFSLSCLFEFLFALLLGLLADLTVNHHSDIMVFCQSALLLTCQLYLRTRVDCVCARQASVPCAPTLSAILGLTPVVSQCLMYLV